MRILLIEDDDLLGDGLVTALSAEGHAVDWLKSGGAALAALSAEHFDLVLLDLGLPGMDGVETLRRIRAGRDAVPVIIVTARDTVPDRVAGLDSGADDYLVKPFELDELYARIRAVSRRRGGHSEATIRLGPLVLDTASRQVSWKGQPVELRRREFEVLAALVENAGRVMSKDQLEQRLYGWQEEVDSNTVEVHVHHLRRKLASDFIRTVRGIGYVVDRPA